ncbi:MAG: DUF1028 domain-containing protein [Solirubrobacteraceae bacterium]
MASRTGTYSIVARDPQTGELGVAVQSHWFSVGPIVPWARAGVGAVATQANVLVSYGPGALDRLQRGADPQSVLDELTAIDPSAASRQVAVVDAQGRVAVHTGESCIAFAGHAVGEAMSCQANMMASRRVWPAMLEAYGQARGSLAERLLAALDAAEAEGGDARGRQSAAIVVVPASGESWQTMVSLRVEDHAEPLVELRRLLHLHGAYVRAGTADELAGLGKHEEAARLYREACELAPGSHELRFWAGLGAAAVGDLETACRDVRAAIAAQPGWLELLGRLAPELAPGAERVRHRLQ